MQRLASIMVVAVSVCLISLTGVAWAADGDGGAKTKSAPRKETKAKDGEAGADKAGDKDSPKTAGSAKDGTDDKTDGKPKRTAPVRRKQDKPRTSKKAVTWTRAGSFTGTLEDTSKGGERGRGEPKKLEFTVKAERWRMGWTTEEAGRPSSMKVTLYKKVVPAKGDETAKGDKKAKVEEKVKWQRVASLGQGRGGWANGVYQSGAGDYYVELEGRHVKYDLFVEEPQVEDAESDK